MGVNLARMSHNQLGALVSKLLSTDARLRSECDVVDAAGYRVVVSAFDRDSVPDVQERVRAMGGEATVVVAFPLSDEAFELQLGTMTTCWDEAEGEDWPLPVTQATTMGDLLRFVPPGASMSFRSARSYDFEVPAAAPGTEPLRFPVPA